MVICGSHTSVCILFLVATGQQDEVTVNPRSQSGSRMGRSQWRPAAGTIVRELSNLPLDPAGKWPRCLPEGTGKRMQHSAS